MNEKIAASALREKNCIQANKKASEFSSCPFWYYTSSKTINSILDSGKIWIRNIASMNDLNEAELHSSTKDKVFALCFCNSKSEKIPMWYLYSGILGQGMRLGLTPSMMLSFINQIDHFYIVDQNGELSSPINMQGNMELRFGWIYYKKVMGV